MKRRKQREIERALRKAWGTSAAGDLVDAAALDLWRLLGTGAGEEALIDRLVALDPGTPDGPAQGRLARTLLKIGVEPRPPAGYRGRRHEDTCTLCRQHVSFCWGCPCGFRICQDCTEENRWGITCNNVTWECPDCGGMRSF